MQHLALHDQALCEGRASQARNPGASGQYNLGGMQQTAVGLQRHAAGAGLQRQHAFAVAQARAAGRRSRQLRGHAALGCQHAGLGFEVGALVIAQQKLRVALAHGLRVEQLVRDAELPRQRRGARKETGLAVEGTSVGRG